MNYGLRLNLLELNVFFSFGKFRSFSNSVKCHSKRHIIVKKVFLESHWGNTKYTKMLKRYVKEELNGKKYINVKEMEDCFDFPKETITLHATLR